MDWNWFYSSAAQSVAAIVGIIAAFAITKIINSQTIFARDAIEMKNLFSISERLSERADHVCFKSYNWHLRVQEFSSLKDRLKNESTLQSPDEYFSQLHFSEYDSRQDIIAAIETMIQSFRNGSHRSLPNYALASRTELDDEKLMIDSFLADVRQNTRTVSNFLDSIEGNPQSSSLITVAIVSTLVLFFVGVIYPLSFLPFDDTNAPVFALSVLLDNLGSPKGIILELVSIIFLSIMTVFLVVNLRLRHDSDELQQIRSFTQLAAYSEYLGYLETNLQIIQPQTPHNKRQSGALPKR